MPEVHRPLDTNQPAVAMWMEQQKPVGHSHSRYFTSLTQAIVFVMTSLPLSERPSAVILLASGTLQFDEIEREYQLFRSEDPSTQSGKLK